MDIVKRHFWHFALFILLVQPFRVCSEVIGVVGGRNSDDIVGTIPFAGLVSSDGTVTELTGINWAESVSFLTTVSINASGAGIIGGERPVGAPFAAVFSASGVATEISGAGIPTGDGTINSVSISHTGFSLIGGQEQTTLPYAAVVSSSGITTQVFGAGAPSGDGEILSCSINDTGQGIIGGSDDGGSDAYMAFVSSSGLVTEITGPSAPTSGVDASIRTVAINSSGTALVAGSNGGPTLYAALVSPSGDISLLTGSDAPSGGGFLVAADINDSNQGIVGGANSGGIPYAALVSPEGVATRVSGADAPATTGLISTVAINSSGQAIIGGISNGSFSYAAFVSPSAEATQINFPPTVSISDVAIDQSGAALVGGSNNSIAYGALVSPSGEILELTGDTFPIAIATTLANVDLIQSADVIFASITPSSFGPGNSFANSLFALSSEILPNHSFAGKASLAKSFSSFPQEELVASTSVEKVSKHSCLKKPNYCIWGSLFGEWAHQKKSHQIPAIDHWIGGFVTAFDYLGVSNSVIGGAFAFAYNYADLSESEGHAKTSQELFSLYASWMKKHFFVQFALWGGPYQMKNERHSAFQITSSADVDGWLFLPHLELSFPFYKKKDSLLCDPFIMLDWAHNWQGSVKEKGNSGFNLEIDSQYCSLLRTEAGLRLLEPLECGFGTCLLEQKLSWIHKHPFQVGPTQAFFVGSISSFGIDVFSNSIQNLGALQLSASFLPCSPKYPYGSFNYQAEFNRSFQSHFVSFEVGYNF